MPLLSWKVSTYVEFVFAAVEFSSADTFNASADISLITLLSSKGVTCWVTLASEILAVGTIPDVKLLALKAVKSIVSKVGSAPLFALKNLPSLEGVPCWNLFKEI